MKWILRNLSWKDMIHTSDIKNNLKSFIGEITGQYDMQFIDENVSELKELQDAYTDWLRYSPISDDVLPDDLGNSFIKSLENTKYDGAVVASEELLNYLVVYGQDIGNHLVKSMELMIDNRFIMIGLVASVFLSILHNEMNMYKTVKVEIMDVISKEKKVMVIGMNERNKLREYMDTLGLPSFELKDVISESGGASERKDAIEISDLEDERRGEMDKILQIFVINEKDVRFRA